MLELLMGERNMFTRRKDELEFLRKSFESLENSQKSTELMVSSVCQMLNQNTQKQEEESMILFSDEEKKRAAYALNLCTVSVSQIIDYNDVNILEQEYETILNNLNLEHMPKDEALLSILKQLLDTVTYFRIQDGDKEFVEKEYQHKMKNAIWSAVPNFGIVAAGGNPFIVAASLATQVGIGYMNYRKAKLNNGIEKEQRNWQLQRAAIEQLNGLRRELFDASWRLADKYKFPDEYRLTERQITQYNKILMDSDDLRKYERLEAVQKFFSAYPPFWYYFGHAANIIAHQALDNGENAVYNKYKQLAISHFETYMQVNRYALLREDQITSSCALEYIDLLDNVKDKEKIKELLDFAERMSGYECDILQLCAIAYLRIGEINQSMELLKYLVNESYNVVTNAQLLSSIYVNSYFEDKTSGMDVDYKMLTRKVNEDLLFPFPKTPTDDIVDLKRDFVGKQQVLLLQKYAYVLEKYIRKYNIQFNKCIPVPYEERRYSDSFFYDQEQYMQERRNQYKILFSNENKIHEYSLRLAETNIPLAYLEIFNEMLNSIEYIIPDAPMKRIDTMQQLAECIERKILNKKEEINDLQRKINDNCNFKEFKKEFEKLFDLNYEYFTEDFFKRVVDVLKTHVFSLQHMLDFSREETILHEFCIKEGIPEFKIVMDINSQSYGQFAGEHVYLSSELLGGEALENTKMLLRAKKMAKCIEQAIGTITSPGKNINVHIRGTTKDALHNYLNVRKYAKNLDCRIVAVIEDSSLLASKKDLIFTIDGIIVDKTFTRFNENIVLISYSDVTNDDGGLKIGNDVYKNKGVITEKLFDLIQELSEMVVEVQVKEEQNGRGISHNEPYLIEKSSNDEWVHNNN